jgi:TPR repeat protein
MWKKAFSSSWTAVKGVLLIIPLIELSTSVLALYNIERPSHQYEQATRPWLLAELGSTEAQIRMAEADRTSEPNGNEDEETVYWLRKAARAGSLPAQIDLYRTLIQMSDVELRRRPYHMLPEAITWARIAAQQNNFLAEADLSCIYAIGIGIPTNEPAARYWLNRAKEHAHHQQHTFVTSICGIPL